MKKVMVTMVLAFGILNFSTKSVYANVVLNNEFIKITKEFLPSNSILISPERPFSTQPIQQYDFNQDGQDEIIISFEIKGKEQPSPSQFRVILLKKEKKGWQKVWETKKQGVGLDFSSLADITGDGTKEYLFGWTIGAAAGNNLEIFKWENNSLKKIADVPYYHKLELLDLNQKVGLAVWKWYIGESYLVDVLKWNGEKLEYDEELYSKYYPIIEKFYQEEISKMDAWFYWYCLADAQIKANLFEEAAKSIQKGSLLAKQLSLPDEVQNFNKLRDKLEEKKKDY